MITLFVPGTPKNSNASRQWSRFAAASNRRTFRLRTAQLAAKHEWPDGIPEFVRVRAKQISNVNRRRDPGGLAERLKPLLDGLVDGGLLEDDNEDRIELVLERSEKRPKPHPVGIELTLEPACPPSKTASSSPPPPTDESNEPEI